MSIIKTILVKIRQKIPSWKTDVGRDLDISMLPIPRNQKVSGHFRLNNENFLIKSVGNRLIIKLIEQ
jgi:hypothetical protein